MSKLKNSNETFCFCMIFKQFVFGPKWFLGAIHRFRKNETLVESKTDSYFAYNM